MYVCPFPFFSFFLLTFLLDLVVFKRIADLEHNYNSGDEDEDRNCLCCFVY